MENNDDKIIYFDKPKSELSLLERHLLKHFPEKYKRKRPNKTKKVKFKELTEEERIWITNEEFANLLNKYYKNPKKYEKKMQKRQKLLNKYFKSSDEIKFKKKDKWRLTSLNGYLDFVTYHANIDKLGLNSKKQNPNKKFMSHFSDVGVGDIDFRDDRKMSLLKELENEVLSNLQSDYMFDADRLTVEYMNDKGKKKKKHKKGKFNIEDLGDETEFDDVYGDVFEADVPLYDED